MFSRIMKIIGVSFVIQAIMVYKDSIHSGKTPLYTAVADGDLEAIVALQAAGADVNVQNENGIAPIHGAAYLGNVEAIRVLKNLGANVNVQERRGITPIHAATINEHIGAIHILKELGANINLPTFEGKTSIFIAAEREKILATMALLGLGANASIQTIQGDTALECAKRGMTRGAKEITRLLEEHLLQYPTGVATVSPGDTKQKPPILTQFPRYVSTTIFSETNSDDKRRRMLKM